MTTPAALKNRATATRQILIDEAERLFGEHGVAGVSLRQIASAAGAGNTSAVAYHFVDKDGLVRAIFQQRLTELELRRTELLHEAALRGVDHDLSALVNVLYRPLAEQRNAIGQRSYAAFMSGLLRMGEFAIRLEQTAAAAPVAEDLAMRIRELIPTHSADSAYRRQRLATMFVCDSLMLIDSMPAFYKDESEATAISEIFSMATAALSARC